MCRLVGENAEIQFLSISHTSERTYFYVSDSGTPKKNRSKHRLLMLKGIRYLIYVLLQGPDEDTEEESELSVTELKELREKQKKEVEILRAERDKEEETEEPEDDSGCSWGMGMSCYRIDNEHAI